MASALSPLLSGVPGVSSTPPHRPTSIGWRGKRPPRPPYPDNDAFWKDFSGYHSPDREQPEIPGGTPNSDPREEDQRRSKIPEGRKRAPRQRLGDQINGFDNFSHHGPGAIVPFCSKEIPEFPAGQATDQTNNHLIDSMFYAQTMNLVSLDRPYYIGAGGEKIRRGSAGQLRGLRRKRVQYREDGSSVGDPKEDEEESDEEEKSGDEWNKSCLSNAKTRASTGTDRSAWNSCYLEDY